MGYPPLARRRQVWDFGLYVSSPIFRILAASLSARAVLCGPSARQALLTGTSEETVRTLIISERRLRAMYAGGRGNPAARRFARLWASVFGLGLQPRRWVTLEVAGRRSGRVARFPLGMADWDGQWYLVSMLGEGCNWVQNVRAADGRAVLRRRRAVTCQLAEVPAAERPAIISRYLEKVPGGRPHIPVRPTAPLPDFSAVAPRYPVFWVTPVDGRLPSPRRRVGAPDRQQAAPTTEGMK